MGSAVIPSIFQGCYKPHMPKIVINLQILPPRLSPFNLQNPILVFIENFFWQFYQGSEPTHVPLWGIWSKMTPLACVFQYSFPSWWSTLGDITELLGGTIFPVDICHSVKALRVYNCTPFPLFFFFLYFLCVNKMWTLSFLIPLWCHTFCAMMDTIPLEQDDQMNFIFKLLSVIVCYDSQ